MRDAVVDMGPDGWQLDLDRAAKGSVDRALLDRRPGLAWAMSPQPGVALHAALCRAAGLDPDEPGASSGIARMLGRTRQGYHRLVHEGSVQMVAEAASSLGFYTVALPGDGGIRYLVGDMPIELEGTSQLQTA